MIAVLPLVLYPLLGDELFPECRSSFANSRPKCWWPAWTVSPSCRRWWSGKRFATRAVLRARRRRLLEVEIASGPPRRGRVQRANRRGQSRRTSCSFRRGLPREFSKRSSSLPSGRDPPRREPIKPRRASAERLAAAVYWSDAKEKSKIGYARVMDILDALARGRGSQPLEASRLPATAAKPFWIESADVRRRGASDRRLCGRGSCPSCC